MTKNQSDIELSKIQEITRKATETKSSQITNYTNQINNINIVGQILQQEADLIRDYLKGNTLLTNEADLKNKVELQNLVIALGVSVSYFESKIKGLEVQLKKTKGENEQKDIKLS